MKQKILVTGGAGYLGSTLVPELLYKGYAVTVVDNFMYQQDSLSHICHNVNFKLKRGDVRDEALIKSLLKDVDMVIPLAAIVGAPLCDRDPLAASSINHDAIIMMMKYMSTNQQMIIPITNSGYGVGQEGKFCTEESALRPVSLYGKLKVQVEQKVLDRKNAISLRLATVFGMSPRMRIDLLVNDFVHRAVRDRFLILFESHFKRNYIHVRDVSRAFLHGLENFDKLKNEPYNVGLSDANISKWELCEIIKRYIPEFYFEEAAVGEDPDKRDYIVSNEKIEKTGFKPQHSLDLGIQELIKGYQMINNARYTNI
ncbi:MAG: nucleoside-diphosphate-sugar epimerase [Candidatus Omnitrophota bacterium]|jgi:nucleoside-diphosphate-sugar epimerase